MADDTRWFLDALYGNFEEGLLTLWSPGRPAGWFDLCTFTPSGVSNVAEMWQTDVFVGVATRDPATVTDTGRGKAEDCYQLPGLWLDIDIEGPGHKQGGSRPLATDESDAFDIISEGSIGPDVRPTLIVQTGGGLHAWWLFTEPVDVFEATTIHLLDRWAAHWESVADRLNVQIDNVFDVARVMRVPGTLNTKGGLKRKARLAIKDSFRYDLSTFDDNLPAWDPPPERASTPTPRDTSTSGLPGDAYNADTSPENTLLDFGWTFSHMSRSRAGVPGDMHYVRPGKLKRDGHSATVFGDTLTCRIWSDTVIAEYPSMSKDESYSAFALYTHFAHRGNYVAAANELRAQGYGEERPIVSADDLVADFLRVTDQPADAPADITEDDWAFIDLGPILDGTATLPEPSIGTLSDGSKSLFYRAMINGLYGEPGKGKTWLALIAACQVVQKGEHVVWVDLEQQVLSNPLRLLQLGLTRDQIIEYFHYVTPYTSLALGSAIFHAGVRAVAPTLVVIDSTAAGMSTEGLAPNDEPDVERWFSTWASPLLRMPSAPGVLVIDHVVKNAAERGDWASGSQRKKGIITAAYMVTEAPGKELGRGREGHLVVKCVKDRHGVWVAKQHAATFVLDEREPAAGIKWSLEPVDPDETPEAVRVWRTRQMVYSRIESNPGLSQKQIEQWADGGDNHPSAPSRAEIRRALEWLVNGNYVGVTKSRHNTHNHVVIAPFEGPEALLARQDGNAL